MFNNYKEIVTKTIIGKGKKIFKDDYEIKTDKDVDTVLGCWVINHDIKGRKDGDKIKIYGSYDINIWYSYDGNTKTDVISKKINYQESVRVKIKENGDLNDNSEIIIRSLIEMMPQMDERVFPLINDYKINLLNPLEITDFSKFETGLRPLFELLKNASDEEKLNDLITKDETFTRVDVETVAAINLFVGTDIKYDEKEEVVNMCKAWDDHKKRGIQEGMQRGMQQGMQQGRLFEIYLSVQEGDYSAKRGAEKAEMSLDEFEKAMSKAGYKIPELV